MEDGSIMFLLGAGASFDAGIPMAVQMNQQLEALLSDKKELCDLYYFLKSSIVYQRGLEGNFEENVGIEDLLGVIEELGQRHKNRLYPFVGAWNAHLTKVGGPDFKNLELLDEIIRGNLISWVKPRNSYRDGSYLQGLGTFGNEYGYSLPIFTLNYDLLVERNLREAGFTVESGFDQSDLKWDAARFERNDADDTNFYLYKLHGSIDWERGEAGLDDVLFCRQDPCDKPDLIFGVNYKLQSGDPYLFYAHELRKYSLESSTRLLFVVGYSYSDAYINKLLSQAIKQEPRKRIVNVAPKASENKQYILSKLGLQATPDSLCSLDYGGRQFFEKELTMDLCERNVSTDTSVPF